MRRASSLSFAFVALSVSHCRQPVTGPTASSVPHASSATAVGSAIQLSPPQAQPFIELHTYRQIPEQCVRNKECPDPDVCHRGSCGGGRCMGSPRNFVPCSAMQVGGVSSPGTCFAGQCVTEERWVEVCGRVMGHMHGRDISLVGYRYEVSKCPPLFGREKCRKDAEKSFDSIAAGNARDLLKCLQYPHLAPPEGYLFNWDGNDPSDLKGKGARQP